MTSKPVEWVLVVRYVMSTHRATYGRLAGNKYTKDYIQLYKIQEFIEDLETAFPALTKGGPSVDIAYKWPAGSAAGKIFRRSADRPHLAWETRSGAPRPWKMLDQPTASSAETVRGDPSHSAEGEADLEYENLISSGFGQPFLIAVKLEGEEGTLHLGVLVEDADEQFSWADLKRAPPAIQELAAETSPRRALAWRSFVDEDDLQGLRFDPSTKVDAWGVASTDPGDGGKAAEPSLDLKGTAQASDLDSDLVAEDLDHSEEEVSKFERRLESGNYEVADAFATTKTRGSAQKVFADEVKDNYGWRCALTGIRTKRFLVASHIVPWSVDEKIRLDPSNGICLSVLVDRAFEGGFLIVQDDLVVTVDHEKVGRDAELLKQLRSYDGMKLEPPKAHPPKVDYLRRRRSL